MAYIGNRATYGPKLYRVTQKIIGSFKVNIPTIRSIFAILLRNYVACLNLISHNIISKYWTSNTNTCLGVFHKVFIFWLWLKIVTAQEETCDCFKNYFVIKYSMWILLINFSTFIYLAHFYYTFHFISHAFKHTPGVLLDYKI